MSYILDALRKADAERERGTVPSIHAQPMSPGPGSAGAPRAARGPLGVIAAAVALVIVGAGAAWWVLSARMRDTVPALPTTAAQAASAPAPVVASSVPAPAAAPPVVAAAPAPSTVAAPTPRPAPAATPRKPRPAAAAPARATAPSPAPGPAVATAPAPFPQAATSPGNGPLAGKVYALNELPDEIRRQLPQVNIGGSMFSPVRENRILIVNGQVLHEGDRITPELVVDQVRVKAAVLAFRGYRYLLPF